MDRIIIEHLTGEKAHQTETFDARTRLDLLVGRDLAAQLRFSDASDSVSRQHARITFDPAMQDRLQLHDLGSRNSLLLNGKPSSGSSDLRHGDTVQLGIDGPSFVVRMDPPPAPQPAATRLVELPGATREVRIGPSSGMVVDAVPASASGAKTPVGRDTVQRMVQLGQAQANKRLWAWGAGMVTVLVIAGSLAYSLVSSRQTEQAASQEASAVIGQQLAQTDAKINDQESRPGKQGWQQQAAQAYSGSVVYIEASWRLMDKARRSPVYHVHKEVEIDKQKVALPMYVMVDDETLEPMLSTNPGSGPMIGGTHSGTGFVVHKDGFIVTNRHVASTWMTRMPDILHCPCGIVRNGKVLLLPRVTPEMQTMIRNWVPAQSRQGGGSANEPGFFGENQVLDVSFPNTRNRIVARLSSVSNQHDVALMRIDAPFELKPLPLADDQSRPVLAQEILVMGYPGVSPKKFEKVEEQDPFNRASTYALVPQVTVTPGAISQVSSPTEAGKQVSTMGDVYQLTVNATGAGNSGGPMFDDSGKVSGIYFAGGSHGGASVSYAVPIRYALDLMSGAKGSTNTN